MKPTLLIPAAYLIGAIPFGYLVGRAKGVDLFAVGSGNIGATNAGRVLGRGYGLLVFALDFLKGAGPVAAAAWADPGEGLRVAAAAAAFLGHLFPVYLGFRGGKGVATGAGVVAVLVPGPFLLALVGWGLTALLTRLVSLASVVAATLIVVGHLASGVRVGGWVTLFCVAGAALVVVKHRANVGRLLAGTENRIEDGPMRQTALKIIHLLAVGLWFGGAAFFSFAAAPAIFASFAEVVENQPSDRTAGVRILPENAPKATKDALASALAGAAVGPVFPRFFLMQAVCGGLAMLTAATWRNADPRRWHRRRLVVLLVAWLAVGGGWAISDQVSRLRHERFDPNPAVADAARGGFVAWHLVSLGLSGATTLLAGLGLAMAAGLPGCRPDGPPGRR
jgi:acyl-phosphate glycerol 3-phosphate acyltransferase